VRILITGADGFAGRYLIRELLNNDDTLDLHGTTFRDLAAPPPEVTYHTLDLRDENRVSALLAEVQPDQIFHLAAQANVGQSYVAVWSTLENNIRAQLNLILACVDQKRAPRMMIVSSGEIYGDQADDTPFGENAPLRPSNPYTVSKATQDMLALQYYLSHQLPILRARPFNHLGPGQSRGFVATDFAMQIAQIEFGQQTPVLHVGKLTSERDFTDVRDVVRAYRLIMERGAAGSAYNIASGQTWTMRQVLETLLSHSALDISIEIDPARVRPGERSKSWGSAAHLHEVTGWQPTIPIAQTLSEVLDDCRQRVQMVNKES
jgi:GDP-4-dehydro-6-deoxy-D-mannose reductase